MDSSLLATLATAPDDQLVAGLVRAAGAALRLAARVDRVTSTGRLALVDVRLLGVADLTDGGAAAHVDVPDFAGRHPELGVRPVLRDELHLRTRGTGDLGTAAGPEL